MDADHHEAGDALARRLREALGARFGLLSVFVGERQILLGTDGLPAGLSGVREVPVLEGFCRYVKDTGHQLIVDDARVGTGIAAHPLVTELQVQAYAGWHVTDVDGRTVGVLGAMDVVPRAWTSGELLALMDLAHECAPVVRAVAEAARAEDRERTAAASG